MLPKLIYAALVGVLLLLLCIGACSYLIREMQGDIEAERPAIESAGKDFGVGTDEYGCVKETVARIGKDQSMKGAALANAFLTACLTTCVATQGFCDGVPKWQDRFESKSWSQAICNDFGQGNIYCAKVIEQIPQYCDRTRFR